MKWPRFWKFIFGGTQYSTRFKKGEKFEAYSEKFFPSTSFDLVHRTSDYRTNRKRFIESSLKPDFLFRDKVTRRLFYVECKFRASMINGRIECCTSHQQLARNFSYHHKIPVYLLVGLGGRPNQPIYLFFIPLDEITETQLSPSVINQFRVSIRPPLVSSLIWRKAIVSTNRFK